MAKPGSSLISLSKRGVLLSLVMFSLATGFVFFMRSAFDACDLQRNFTEGRKIEDFAKIEAHEDKSPLEFMRSRVVLLVSHELSLSGASKDANNLLIGVYFNEQDLTVFGY